MWQQMIKWVSGEPREKRVVRKITAEYNKVHPVPKEDRRPWYKKHQIKRSLGLVLGTIGTGLITGGSVLYGSLVLGVAGVVEGIGLFDAKKKSGTDQTDSLGTALVAWFRATMNLIKVYKRERNKQ